MKRWIWIDANGATCWAVEETSRGVIPFYAVLTDIPEPPKTRMVNLWESNDNGYILMKGVNDPLWQRDEGVWRKLNLKPVEVFK